MADEKNVVKGKETKPSFMTKLVSFFKRLPGIIARPFKNMWHELRKVTWPTKQDLINTWVNEAKQLQDDLGLE